MLPVWTATTGGTMESSPAVAYGQVFIGSDDHTIYAFDADTGALDWRFQTGDIIQLTSPAVANGVVYCGSSDRNIYALDASTGAELWHYTAGAEMNTAPAVADGVLYMGTADYNLYAFHLPG